MAGTKYNRRTLLRIPHQLDHPLANLQSTLSLAELVLHSRYCTSSTMLISPLRLHHDLTSILSPTIDAGPHTALLILPEGRLLSSATRYDELYAEEAEGEAEEADNAPDMNGLSVSGGISGGAADGGEEGEGEEEEPYLDEPERIRLLCGLASQWEEDESPRVECEVSLLFQMDRSCKLVQDQATGDADHIARPTASRSHPPPFSWRTEHDASEFTGCEGVAAEDVCARAEWDERDCVE